MSPRITCHRLGISTQLAPMLSQLYWLCVHVAFHPLHTLFIFAALHCAQLGPNSILRSSCHFTYIACVNVLACVKSYNSSEVQVIFCAWLSHAFTGSVGLVCVVFKCHLDCCFGTWYTKVWLMPPHRKIMPAQRRARVSVYPLKIHISFGFVPIECHSRPIRPYFGRPIKVGVFSD